MALASERVDLDFSRYQPAHRARLQALAQSRAWRALLERPELVHEYRQAAVPPPAAPAQARGALNYLIAQNGAHVRGMIDAGERDEEQLAQALGSWDTILAAGEPWALFFLGLVLTIACSFDPRRCLYCNQAVLPRRLQLAHWKAVLDEAARAGPPYVYLTGGEPLVLGTDVWGDDGLVAHATRLGCAVNLNTNAELITPRVALQLVKVGLARTHISLDAADPATQGVLFRGRERVARVWRGLFNLQVAREVLGVNHPQIHINCVLTRLNLFQVPDLLRCLLGIRKLPVASPGRPGSSATADPALADFAFHLIPVGGRENEAIRPTAAEWKRFYTETWSQMERIWAEYQAASGVAAGARRSLAAHVPFANPYQRVDHRRSLDEYCALAARGAYWQGALSSRCYVAPSQAYVLPDGSQHWCGAHAVRRPRPLGNVLAGGLRETIRANTGRPEGPSTQPNPGTAGCPAHADTARLAGLAALPGPDCVNCAGATCVINQSVERGLHRQVTAWLQEAALTP